MNKYFKDYFCPSCNKQTKIKKLNFDYKTNRYTKNLNDKFNISEKLIIENTELSQCLDCHLIFFNKWIKESYIKILYSETIHHAGWNRLFMILNQNQKFINKRYLILKYIENRFNNIKSYAEFGCPFMGLLLFFNLIKNKNNSLITNINNIFLKKNIDDSKYYKQISIFYKIIKFVNYTVFKIYNFFNFIYTKNFSKNFDIKINLEKLFFINYISERNWNLSCNMMNINCRNLISKIDNINYIELKDLNQKIDLIYLDNVIDHTDEILNILNKIFIKSDNIVIQAHGIQGGIQHSFFLTLDYLKKISTKFSFNVEVLNKDLKKIENDSYLEDKFYILQKLS